MDKRKNNKGTIGNKGGRKTKADEQKLLERLSPMQDEALIALKKSIQDKQGWALKMYFEYMYGKPKERIEIDNIGEKLTPTIIFHGRYKDK